MELADILSKDRVIAGAKVGSKRQLLQMMADKVAQVTELDAHGVFETLMAREQLGSTGLGNGIAIPHGKLQGLSSVIAVFARLDAPIDFDSVDDQPVDLAVMLLAPAGAGADHLKALARVSRLLRTEHLVEQLRQTRDAGKLYDILTSKAQAPHAA